MESTRQIYSVFVHFVIIHHIFVVKWVQLAIQNHEVNETSFLIEVPCRGPIFHCMASRILNCATQITAEDILLLQCYDYRMTHIQENVLTLPSPISFY